MGLGRYLATALLAGAAFLYSPSLHAEDTQQKVTFKDSAAQARVTPGRTLEGRISVSASREKNKLVLEISAKDCEIRTGFSEFYIGLPAESEIAEMKQTAKIKERAQDGQGEEKWIDLYTVNELVEKGIFKAADYVADKVKVPVLTELFIDKVEKTKAARIQEWYKQMKKKGLFMEELSPDYPKIPSAHLTNLARKYEITLDVEPTRVPEARMQICLQDQYERTVTINDISVKFDGKSKLDTQTPAQLPKDLEGLLIKDPELKLMKYYGPKELSQSLNSDIRNTYLLKYQHISNSEEDYVVWVEIVNRAELKTNSKVTSLIEEYTLHREVSKRSIQAKENKLLTFGFTLGILEENSAMYHVLPSMSSMRRYLETGDMTMFKNIEMAREKYLKMIEDWESKKAK